jgi:cytoskeletal protein CcmA (bactofilin family)
MLLNSMHVTGTTLLADFDVTDGAVNLSSLSLAILDATEIASAISDFGDTAFSSIAVSGTTTLTGAVSLGSTLGVTGTTTLAALNTGAIGTGAITVTGALGVSGTATLGALTVSGATTLTGAATATNASNNINLGTDALNATVLAASAVTEIQSGLALSTQVDALEADVTAIKAKTDSLTFTVAGKVDANIRAVNSVAVGGTGAVGNRWGPG